MISAIFVLVTKASRKNVVLDWVLYIHYSIQFKKNKVQALIHLGNKINAITPAFAFKLGLKIYYTNIGAKKIDNFTPETFEMVLTSFQIEDKLILGKYFIQIRLP